MNTEAVDTIIAKNPTLKAAQAKLAAMEPGAYCIHQSWGFGQIKSYNEDTQRLIIDFLDKKGHSMDPAFCISTMEVLPDNHLLVRKQTESELIAKLIAEDPAQLAVEALAAYPNQAATAIELEILFAQVIGDDKKFKKWWTNARKAIAKDPRITIPAKKTECYIIRETPISMLEEIVDAFQSTRSARRRIKLVEDLFVYADKSEASTAALREVLDSLAEVIKGSNQLTLAERLYGAAVRDDLAKFIGAEDSFEPAQVELIADTRELASIAAAIPVQFQARLLDLIKEAHAVEYRDIVFNLLKGSHGKFTTECINFLIENGYSDELASSLARWQTEQNLHPPVLLWIIKNRNSKKFAKLVNGLISPRLLSSIFYAIDYEALQAASARRIPLADILGDDRELIPDLLATADTETARDLANTLLLNQGFEDLAKKSLLARFIKLFPSVQSLVSGSDSESQEAQLIVSRESYEQKSNELELIVNKKIPENSRAIAIAREHGDLKENSEYKMAKQDQAVLMAQKAQIERDLAHAHISDFSDANLLQVSAGSIVTLGVGSTGKTATYTILGAWDSDPDQNIIAYKTPLGRALVGCQIGDVVNVKVGDAEEEYTVKSIARYVDRAS